MSYTRALICAAAATLGLAAAQAQTPAAPALPQHESDPVKLPAVYAVGVRVSDMAESVKFYREGLGAVSSRQITPREIALTFAGGPAITLIQADPDTPFPARGRVGMVLQTADIDGLVARVKALGATVEREPSDGSKSMGIRIAMIHDPDGVRIEVLQFP